MDGFTIGDFISDPSGSFTVMRGVESVDIVITDEFLRQNSNLDGFGAEFYDFVSFPRVKILDVTKGTPIYKSGIRSGDVIISVNGEQIFSVEDYEDLVRGEKVVEYKVYRNGFVEPFIVEFEQTRNVIISKVIPDMPADMAGFEEGDIVISVNGNEINDSQELIAFVAESPGEVLAYLIERDGERIFYEVELSEDGKIGVLLSELMSYSSEENFSLYNSDILSSVVNVKDEQYPVHVALYKSFTESVRLGKLTAKMFGEFVGSLFTSGEVPDSVAGPVGIAQMTHVFVQEGFISILRFVAILSLSLAVINILPIPALDGGRLLFILIELLIGRRVNQKAESYIHALGYFLILLLIVVVTYSDILRLLV